MFIKESQAARLFSPGVIHAHMNILLVDDDDDDRMVFTTALETLDLPVNYETAKDGQSGLDLINNKLLFFPDYIFLDLNMPGMTGFELLKQLKQTSVIRTIPVIIYTTSNHQRDIDTAFRLGAYGFICKPSRFQQLQSILREILTEKVLTFSSEKLIYRNC
jgi:CheY-like chemotaxis protein